MLSCTLELRAPALVVLAHAVQLLQEHVGDVVLLRALEHDGPRLAVRRQRRVEELLLEQLVHGELGGQAPQQLRPPLHRPRRGGRAGLEQRLEAR